MNKGKKALAVLSTAALLGTTPAAVALPFLTATVAHAAGSATALVVPNINSSVSTADLGTIDLFIPKGALASTTTTDATLSLVLPSGFQFSSTGSIALPDPNFGSNGTTYKTAADAGISFAAATPTLAQLTITNAASLNQTDDWHVYLPLKNLKVQGPSAGPVNVTLMAPSTSPLPGGSVTVGNVVTTGVVDVAASDVQSSSDSFTFTLAVTEEVKGSLRPGNSIKLKLPSGFMWTNTGNPVPVYGDTTPPFTAKIQDDQDLYLQIPSSFTGTQSASSYLITGLGFAVKDETIAKTGDVTVQVSGTSNVNNTSLVVGHYGQVGFQVTAESTPDVIAGQAEQKIGDIIIKETVPGSFAPNRTVTLTLPDQARWEVPFENPDDNSSGGSIQGVNGVILGNGNGTTQVYTDTDKRTLKIYVSGATDTSGQTNPGEIDLRNMQIAVQPGYTGDIVVQMGGTEGVTGNVTVAKAQAPVSIKADSTPNVIIGSGGQDIGTITLTENVAGGFARTALGETHNTVTLELPQGVQFDGTPDVQVTQGDLSIKDVTTGVGSDDNGANNKGYLRFTVDAESTTPSVVTIKNAKLKLDRTVPQGDIVLKVKGDSVAFTATLDQSWKANNTTAASTTIAEVVTPAQAGTITATFTVGSTTYTVDGQQQTMDVAPYLKNDGRVMLPVRYVANALGVNDNSIIWNQGDQSVTIFKDGNVVKMTIGSNTMIVNGTAVTMDVAPELYNDGRTMLPLRWVAQALNANITWDQNTQTATVTTKPITTYQQ